VYLLRLQTKEIETSKETSTFSRSADFVLKFDERLEREPFSKIRYTIDNNRPLLKTHGGKFSDDDLEGYLDIYETIAHIYAKGLITKDMLDIMYGYSYQKTFDNSEVRDYLKVIRKDDPSFYMGGESLAKHEGRLIAITDPISDHHRITPLSSKTKY